MLNKKISRKEYMKRYYEKNKELLKQKKLMKAVVKTNIEVSHKPVVVVFD